jgi:hypothetical protein
MSSNVISLAARARAMTREQVGEFLADRAYKAGPVAVCWGDAVTDLLVVTADRIAAALAVDAPAPFELVDQPDGTVSWRRVPKQAKHTVLACWVHPGEDGAE